MNPTAPTALIAEDEPLLAKELQAELACAWPELHVAAVAGDGESAVQLALRYLPDVLFFDVRMPGLSGLEAAERLADEWPADTNARTNTRAFPLLVFVTAYDQYAVQAFETQAVDYLLKPVEPQRLAKTVQRLQAALVRRVGDDASHLETTLTQLRDLLHVGAKASDAPLRFIQAGVGTTIKMVPIDEVLYFEAADKYVRVVTASEEHLIRTPLKDLLPRLDSAVFWQIHRGTLVRASSIEQIVRDDSGRLLLRLRGSKDTLAVSRLYAHLFKSM